MGLLPLPLPLLLLLLHLLGLLIEFTLVGHLIMIYIISLNVRTVAGRCLRWASMMMMVIKMLINL